MCQFGFPQRDGESAMSADFWNGVGCAVLGFGMLIIFLAISIEMIDRANERERLRREAERAGLRASLANGVDIQT
jgi:hypothetical protein